MLTRSEKKYIENLLKEEFNISIIQINQTDSWMEDTLTSVHYKIKSFYGNNSLLIFSCILQIDRDSYNQVFFRIFFNDPDLNFCYQHMPVLFTYIANLEFVKLIFSFNDKLLLHSFPISNNINVNSICLGSGYFHHRYNKKSISAIIELKSSSKMENNRRNIGNDYDLKFNIFSENDCFYILEESLISKIISQQSINHRTHLSKKLKKFEKFSLSNSSYNDYESFILKSHSNDLKIKYIKFLSTLELNIPNNELIKSLTYNQICQYYKEAINIKEMINI